MKNQTLQRQFQMWTILLIVVPSMLIMSIYTIGQIAIAKQQNLELIRQRVHSQERLIDYWMGERAISVRELSQTEAFQKLDEREMRAALELKQHSDQKFDSLSYIHKDGFFKMSTLRQGIHYPSAIGKPYYEASMAGKEYISDMVIGRNSGQPIINFSSPIYDKAGVLQGLILGSVKMTTLQILLQENWFGETGEIHLVNSNGTLLNEPRYANILIDQGFIEGTAIMKLKMSEDALRNIKLGENGTANWVNYRGQKVLGAYQYIPQRNWTLIGKINEQEVLTPIYKQLGMMAGTTVILILLILPLITRITNRIKKPIDWLIGQSNLIAEEHYEIVGKDKREEQTNYELTMLCDTFIQMSYKIQSSITLLKEKEAHLGSKVTEIEEINFQLEESNAMLEEEIFERQKAEEKIKKLNDSLEDKVKERTRQLDESNALLLMKIAEQQGAEEALRKSEEGFRTMFEQAPLGIALVDSLTGHFYQVNPRFAEIAGRTMEEMKDLDWMSITHPDDIQEDIDNMTLLNAGKITGFTMNKRYIHPDQSIVWINMTIAPLRDQRQENPCHLCMIEDVTENKKMNERLEKYQILSEKANDIIIFIDDEGNILEVNDAAVRMYGYTFEEFLTMTIFKLRHVEKTTEILEQIRLVNSEGIVFETIHYKKDGTAMHVEVSSQGNLLGNKNVLLSIVRDITERKKTQQEIILAMEKAEAANAAKSQFLANMSHEIRTPMTGIIGMTDITLMTELTAEQREYLTVVKTSTMSLLRILNDILDYSKIEAGKIDLEKLPFSLNNTIHEVLNLFENSAKQKGLALTVHIDKRIPKNIVGDSVRLRQVLSNLVGNGIKFTMQGEVAVNVDIEAIYENNIKLKFVVKDTGIGIAEDKINKLFKRFSQIDDSNTRQFGGTGLGLAISKKLIEIMGGEIGVESKEQIGSTFFFTALFGRLDGNIETTIMGMNHNQLNEYQNFTLKKILLAEDDPVSRNMISILLKKKGFEVIAVENGKEAILAFEKEKFVLILMDINMPYLDGCSAAGIIRQKEKAMDYYTPIVAMTAYALKGDREKCLYTGMDDFISKPINIRQVMDMICKYVEEANCETSNVNDRTIN